MLFLHAAHQARQAFDGLGFVSWAAIGIGVGALVVCWGRILSWVRSPAETGPALRAWGEDAEGWYFILRNGDGRQWSALAEDGRRVSLAERNGALHAAAGWRPAALEAEDGTRLPL